MKVRAWEFGFGLRFRLASVLVRAVEARVGAARLVPRTCGIDVDVEHVLL